MMDEVERPPWWLSGEDSGEEAPTGRERGSAEPNWMSLLGSLGSLASEVWANSGAGEHASHGVPAEHPDCMVCRAMVTISAPSTQPRELPAVRWLPIRRL